MNTIRRRFFLGATTLLICGLCACSEAGTVSKDLSMAVDDALAGPWGAGAGFQHSTSGTGANIAFAVVSYDLVSTNVTADSGFTSGPMAGYDYCFNSHESGELNSLAGGWNGGFTGHPLSWTGVAWLARITSTERMYQLLATPRGHTGVGSITGGSLSVDILDVKALHFQPTFVWNNRNGQPGYNGNFLGGMLILTKDF